MNHINRFLDAVWPWILDHGIKIVAIIVIAYIFRKIIVIFSEKAVRKLIRPDNFVSPEEDKKREDTLIQILNGTLLIFLWIVVAMMVLAEIGVNIGPLIAGAGVAGLALGFGGQYLIKDVISGLFIIIENQYRVGDVVRLNDIPGMVEDVTLRMTTLRDADGTVHHVTHGGISTVANLSKEYSKINIDIGIGYDSDIEKVTKIVNDIGKNLAEDVEWKKSIISAPQFMRIDDFADSAIVIKITGETKPLKQWEVAGELRKRLKVAFDKENIEIPFPQMVVHQK